MEKTAEMTFAEALESMDARQEKLAAAFSDLKVDELEELIKKETVSSPPVEEKNLEKVAADKILMADQWGRELAHEFMEKKALMGVDDLAGGAVGYHMGKKQKERGEKHSFGVPQAASLILPGGAGYQVGRALAHAGDKEKKSFALPSGFTQMMKKAAPTLTKTALLGVGGLGMGAAAGISGARNALVKGLGRAGGALATTTMKQRAGIGAGLGAVAGAMKSPGTDPATGQPKSRLGGALRGAGVGAGLGAAAPHAISAGQKALGGLGK